ncbi:hypothetical protein HPB50_010616 [Hyalomma asiaticum]|uniref:Uncharacterized protein n=1 Tax=Hyalomma asiaticum TaxID=266040 RepID=A0ACB7RZA5_HYAAI|nr:hypothetical protein HPB50_010616 [Hyalomma asiaticum]
MLAFGVELKATAPAPPPASGGKRDGMWFDVGVFKETSCLVAHFYLPSEQPEQQRKDETDVDVVSLGAHSMLQKQELLPGTAYKFRVAAINACGRGPWSEVSAFKTCLPGYPGAPSAIKISKGPDGAHLSWEAPQGNPGDVTEYSVYLAVRSATTGDGAGPAKTVTSNPSQLAFVRVYCGPQAACTVATASLASAHVDTTSKPAIIFRIAARNDKGYGPATQVRWLQDGVALSAGRGAGAATKRPSSDGSIEVTELTEYKQTGNELSAVSVLHISEHCDGDGDGLCVDTSEIRIKSSAARASAGSGDSEDDLWFEESIRATALQVFVPFLAAGFGTVGAGLLLDMVQHWPVFQNVTELFILVPALLGLKGNLEMTMAARRERKQANLGNMDTLREQWKSASGNMALVQCQATVVSLLASLFAVMMGFITERRFDMRNALMLCASSLVTASVASLVLGSVMIGVVILSRKHHINPDNVAIPVAASLGDLTTLALLAGAGSLLFGGTEDVRLYLCVVIFFLLFIPLWVLIARSNTYTSSVLWSGWIPIISAMAISRY